MMEIIVGILVIIVVVLSMFMYTVIGWLFGAHEAIKLLKEAVEKLNEDIHK